MSSDNDRGWNIVGGKARSGTVASLLGRSRNGEPSLLTYIALGLLITYTAVQLGVV